MKFRIAVGDSNGDEAPKGTSNEANNCNEALFDKLERILYG